MPGQRGRPGGFESIKRGTSAGDALIARHLEQSLERIFGGESEVKSLLFQPSRQKMHNWYSSGYLDRKLEGERRLGRWIKEMKAEGCPLDVVLMAIINGASFSDLDKEKHRRKGWSREQLILALRIFRATE